MAGQAHKTMTFVPDCYCSNRRKFCSGLVSSRALTVVDGKSSTLEPDNHHEEVALQISKYTPGILDLFSTHSPKGLLR